MTFYESTEKAIEGGWRPTFNSLPHLHTKRDWQYIVCDQLYWKCLSKTMKWKERIGVCVGCGLDSTFAKVTAWNKCKCGSDIWWEDGWVFYWHRLIDHLSEGRDIDSFFETL